MKRVLIVLILGCAAWFVTRWLASPESAVVSIESAPATSTATTGELELAESEPVVKRGVSSVAEPLATVPAPTAWTNPSPSSGLRLWGTIHTEGIVLRSLDVSCTDGLDFRRGMRADKRSQYSFEGLAPGPYWVSAGTPETGFARARVDLHDDTRVDLKLERPREITVRVLDESGVDWFPPGANAVATESDPGPEFDSDSVMTLAWARPLSRRDPEVARQVFGVISLTTRTSVHVSLVQHETVVTTRLVGPSDTEVAFTVARDERSSEQGSVVFRLVGAEDGEPLRNANAHVTDGALVMPLECPTGSGRATLSPGRWILCAFAPSRGQVEVPFRLEPGAELDLGNIAVGGGFAIRGRIVDESGLGHRSYLECLPCDARGILASGAHSPFLVGAAADGSFEVSGLAPGHHRLSVHAQRREKARADRGYTITMGAAFDFDPAPCVRIVEVRDEDVSGVVLEVRPGIALVVRPSGREKTGAGFRVLTTDGVVVEEQRLTPHDPQRVWLATGSYDVETWTERDGPRERTPIDIVRDRVVVDVR